MEKILAVLRLEHWWFTFLWGVCSSNKRAVFVAKGRGFRNFFVFSCYRVD